MTNNYSTAEYDRAIELISALRTQNADLLAALRMLVNLSSHPLIDTSALPSYAVRIEEARAAIANATKE